MALTTSTYYGKKIVSIQKLQQIDSINYTYSVLVNRYVNTNN